jgi:hypothetical protein
MAPGYCFGTLRMASGNSSCQARPQLGPFELARDGVDGDGDARTIVIDLLIQQTKSCLVGVNDEVDVVGGPHRTVVAAGEGSGDHVVDAGLIEHLDDGREGAVAHAANTGSWGNARRKSSSPSV